MIYLDNNSTTPVHPAVCEAMNACYREAFANSASQHELGRRARRIVEESREVMGELLGLSHRGGDADQLFFTSGGTESNNLAIFGLAGGTPGKIILSSLEHPSVVEPVRELGRRGHELAFLNATSAGTIDPENLAAHLTAPPRLVCAMRANHETGVLQPVGRIAAWAHEIGAVVHCDAVQAAGKTAVHFRELGVDTMSLAAHKFHGPRGIGLLAVRHGVSLTPLLYGGFQQFGIRPGTESVELIVGMRVALELAHRELSERVAILRARRDQLEAGLRSAIPTLVIHGEAADRLPQVTNVSFPQVDRQALVMALDRAGIAVSTGSACQSGSSEPSPVLQAMGVPEELLASAIRISVSCFTTEAEIASAVEQIVRCVENFRSRPARSGRTL